MSKLRFIRKDTHVEVRARLKATGQWAVLGTCHPASVPYLKKDFRANMHLVQLSRN